MRKSARAVPPNGAKTSTNTRSRIIVTGWFREAISDGQTGLASTKRIVMLTAGLTMSLCTLILTIAAFFVDYVIPALTVFGGALAAQAGAGYIGGKFAEAKRDKE